MTRIQQAFEKGPVYIGYITGGDGGIEYCVECAKALIKGGVDLLELGIPFSDPVADGPTIQDAVERSLQKGIKPKDVLEIGRRIREKTQVPLLLFTYYNPLLKGGEPFIEKTGACGFDGILVVDLPPEEAAVHIQLLRQHQLDPVFLASPSTEKSRLDMIASSSKGFVYYACRKGTTGVKNKLPYNILKEISKVKQHSLLPVAVGFGIADKASAKKVLEQADGFVVGSAFVKLMGQQVDPKELLNLAKSIDPR